MNENSTTVGDWTVGKVLITGFLCIYFMLVGIASIVDYFRYPGVKSGAQAYVENRDFKVKNVECFPDFFAKFYDCHVITYDAENLRNAVILSYDPTDDTFTTK